MIQEHRQFCIDMAKAGILTGHYTGRFFWSGPGARVGHIEDALKATKVECLWDKRGNNLVVYPAAYNRESIDELKRKLNGDEFPLCSDCNYRLVDAFLKVIITEIESNGEN